MDKQQMRSQPRMEIEKRPVKPTINSCSSCAHELSQSEQRKTGEYCSKKTIPKDDKKGNCLGWGKCDRPGFAQW